MMGWRTAYDRRDWDAVENWWRACDDLQELTALLDQLRENVPREKLVNGMEENERHVHPDQAPTDWRGAAKILLLGELEAKVLGDPPDELSQWEDLSASTAEKLMVFLQAPEITKGHRALSRSAHAQAALECLETIRRETAAMCFEIDPEGNNPDDRSWVKAVIAQAAIMAFSVGFHARAAIGKEIERHAVRGQKSLKSSQKGGKIRSDASRAKNVAVIAAMTEQINKGMTKSAAAMFAFHKGLGTSIEANLKTYQRHGPTKK